MKICKINIAIGFDGKFVFLEPFIETEETGGLKELFDDLKDNYNDGLNIYSPGLYSCQLVLEHDNNTLGKNPEYDFAYLTITNIEILK